MINEPSTEEPVSIFAKQYDDEPEDTQTRVVGNLALLIMWMQAESQCDRGGSDIELEHDAWRAAEMLLVEARDVLKRMDIMADMSKAIDRRRTIGGAK